MFIGMRLSWRRVIKRRVITGNLLRYEPWPSRSCTEVHSLLGRRLDASYLTRSDAPPPGLLRFLARQIG